MYAAYIGLAVVLLLAGCADSRIATVRDFRAARDRGELDAARRYMAPDPRIWFEERSGPGEPWTLGAGRWAAWDEHFRSGARLSHWRTAPDHVSAVATEINDYYRLTERGGQQNRQTWFFDDQGRIAGFMVQGMPGTRGRMDEFLAWARVEAPGEMGYLMPGGRLDPTGDRAPRFRALLNRWRRTVGLAPIG